MFRSTSKALVIVWVAVGQGMGLSEAEVQLHQVDIRATLHSSPQGASQLVQSGDNSFSKCILGIRFITQPHHTWHCLGVSGVGGIWS